MLHQPDSSISIAGQGWAADMPKWSAIPVSLLYSIALILTLLTGWQILRLDWNSPSQRVLLIQSSIDPNTASWASLTRLPGIGPARAQKIIAYRQRYVLHRHQHPPFVTLESMRKIKGFGPVTLRNLAPYLKFSSGHRTSGNQ